MLFMVGGDKGYEESYGGGDGVYLFVFYVCFVCCIYCLLYLYLRFKSHILFYNNLKGAEEDRTPLQAANHPNIYHM